MANLTTFVFLFAMAVGSLAAVGEEPKGEEPKGEEPKCKPGDYDCGGGERCIPQYYVCDGTYDCGDGNDEINCEEKLASINFDAFDAPVVHIPNSAAHSPNVASDALFGEESEAPTFPLEFGR